MVPRLLGRTNREFPSVWLRLEASAGSGPSHDLDMLAGMARAAGTPIDISSSPALWGNYYRGQEDVVLLQRSSTDLERATDSKRAADLVQAHLIETLSAIGREWVDFYVLRSRTALDEFRLAGALEALESARQEGHLRYLGISCEGDAAATLANWQFHDGFEVLLLPWDRSGSFDALALLALKRRVGLVLCARADNLPRLSEVQAVALAAVSTADQVRAVTRDTAGVGGVT